MSRPETEPKPRLSKSAVLALRAIPTSTPDEGNSPLSAGVVALVIGALALGATGLGPARAWAAEPAAVRDPVAALDSETAAPSGSPRVAGRSLEAQRAPVADTVLQLATLELPRTPPSSLAVQLRLDRVEGWLDARVELLERLRAPFSVALLGFGISGLGASVALGTLDGRPTTSPCPPRPEGPCVNVYTNMDTATTLGLIATTATLSGVIVSTLDEPDQRLLGVLVGPTRVGIGIEF